MCAAHAVQKRTTAPRESIRRRPASRQAPHCSHRNDAPRSLILIIFRGGAELVCQGFGDHLRETPPTGRDDAGVSVSGLLLCRIVHGQVMKGLSRAVWRIPEN